MKGKLVRLSKPGVKTIVHWMAFSDSESSTLCGHELGQLLQQGFESEFPDVYAEVTCESCRIAMHGIEEASMNLF